MHDFNHFLEVLKLTNTLSQRVVSIFESKELQTEILSKESFSNRIKYRAVIDAGITPKAFDVLPENTREFLCSIAKEPARVARVCGLAFHPRLILLSVEPAYAEVFSGALAKEDFWAVANLAQTMEPSGANSFEGPNYEPETALELIETAGSIGLIRWSGSTGEIEKKVLQLIYVDVPTTGQVPPSDPLLDLMVAWFAADKICKRKSDFSKAA